MKQTSFIGMNVDSLDNHIVAVQEAKDMSEREAKRVIKSDTLSFLNDALADDGDGDETKAAVNNLVESAIENEEGDSSVWTQTGEVIDLNKSDFENGQEKKEMNKSFTKLLNKNADIDSLPETGMSRSGEEIELRKTNGKIKWSSWVVTARIVQNTSDIFKGIELLGYEVVFPGGVIISRYELLAKIKEATPAGGETPLETIVRCLELVGKKMDEITAGDLDAVDQRMIEATTKLAEVRVALGK